MTTRLALTGLAAVLLVLASPFSGLAGPSLGQTITRVFSQTPPPGVCYGDEQMTFWPDTPLVGQATTVTVTSARPSTNVGLQGPWDPQFVGVQPGGKGYNWYYRFTPGAPGQYNFNFTIFGWVCTANVVNVIGSGPPPPPPPPPSGGSGDGVNYQIANPTALSSGTMTINVSNQNCSGNLPISIIVAGPLQVGGATARSANFTLFGCNWLTVQYPQQFPGAPPLAGGQYHVEITDRRGNDYVSTFVQVQ